MVTVLDTSFLIDLANDYPGAQRLAEDLAARREALLVPAVALTEFLTGVADPARQRARVARAASIEAFTADDAEAAAGFAAEAFAAGRFPGWTDTMIAGFALRRGAGVVTANPRHFRGVSVVTY